MKKAYLLSAVSALTLYLILGLAGFGEARGKSNSPPPSLVNSAIVYAEWDGSDRSIKVADADGSNQVTLVTRRRAQFWHPSWSPDGNTVIFSSDLDGPGIYRVMIDRVNGTVGDPEKIITINDIIVASTVWSPVKTVNENFLIAYSDYIPGSNRYDIYLFDPAAPVVDGINPFNLTNTPNIDEVIPSWSPDAKKLVAVTLTNDDPPFGIDIFTLGTCVDSGQPVCEVESRRNLIAELSPSPLGPTDVWSPSWANTGNMIAVSGYTPQDQNNDIWVIKFDDDPTNTTIWNLTNTNSANPPDREENSPTWSPDDSQIMYQAWDYLCQPQTNKERGYNLIIRNVDGTNFPPEEGCEEKMIVESGPYSMPNWWRNAPTPPSTD